MSEWPDSVFFTLQFDGIPMTHKKSKRVTPRIVPVTLCISSLILMPVLSGCDGGGSGKGMQMAAPASTASTLTGMVKNQHGPLFNVRIEVHDSDDQIVARTQLDGRSEYYSVTVPSGTRYPIVLVATPTGDTMAEPVKAVVNSPLADSMDISDVSTLVVDMALSMGGLTEANIAKASGGAIGLRQRQGVSAGSGGGGAGPGQSGGGVGHGGHGGHDMSGMGGANTAGDSTGSSPSEESMNH
jgi:hypothetical protein